MSNNSYLIDGDNEEVEFVELDLSAFSHIPFSTQEQKDMASVLSPIQKQFIQNIIAETAVRLVNLEVDADNPKKYELGKAYYLGQIRALQYLLDVSNLVTTTTEM